MPQVQILPANPNFGTQLAHVLGQTFGDLATGAAEGYNLKGANEAIDKIEHPEKYQKQGSQPNTVTGNQTQPAAGTQSQPTSSFAPKIYTPAEIEKLYSLKAKTRGEEAAKTWRDSQLQFQKEYGRQQQKDIESSRAASAPYISQTIDDYRGAKTQEAILDKMQSLNEHENLAGAGAAKFAESLGIPLSVISNPASEEYQKWSQELAKGITKYYGNKILQVEFDNFMKTIPTLMNSKEGRSQIIKNMKLLLKPAGMEYKIIKEIEKENGGEAPHNLKERVFERLEPQLDEWSKEFHSTLESMQDKELNREDLNTIMPIHTKSVQSSMRGL